MSHLQAAGHFQSTSQANHQPTSPTITVSMLAIGLQPPSSLQVASSLQALQIYYTLCKHLALN